MKRILVVVIAVALVGAAFFGGTLYQKSTTPTAGPGAAGGRGGAGGPMANLSAEEQAKISAMSDTERQAYFETQRGSQATSGTVGARGARGGLVEGEVIDVASDTVTVKIGTNSQTVYIDDSTVIGYQEGADKMAAGSSVLIYSTSTADNVVTATAILVKK